MSILSLLIAGVAYGAFYATAPGRQSQGIGPARLLRWTGVGLTAAALALSVVTIGPAAGPVLVLSAMMAVASGLAMAGPFLLPGARRPSRVPSDR